GLALLARVEESLRVEDLLQLTMQNERLRVELLLQCSTLQPADPVLAGERAVQAEDEVVELRGCRTHSRGLVLVLRRVQEGDVDVPVAGVAERERDEVVALAEHDRLFGDV